MGFKSAERREHGEEANRRGADEPGGERDPAWPVAAHKQARFVRVRTAIAAVGLGMVTIVGGAVLDTSAPVASAHGDACTAVPDSGPGFNFHESCHVHDWCYGAKPYGRSEYGRYRCDVDFLNNMNGYCTRTYAWYNPTRAVCLGVASTYYNGVRVGGWYAFWYG